MGTEPGTVTWEEICGPETPTMSSYISNLNKHIKEYGFSGNYGELEEIIVFSLLSPHADRHNGNLEFVPGDTLGHKLVVLVAPTLGEAAVTLKWRDGKEMNIMMTDNPEVIAKLQEAAGGYLN